MPLIEPVGREDLDPDVRERLDAMPAPIAASQYPLVLARNPEVLEAFLNDPLGGKDGLLGQTRREALRIRSAQLGGCDSCQVARYDGAPSEDLIRCMSDPASFDDPRDALAMEFIEKMHLDHLSIDRAFYARLGEVFSVAEILELGTLCARLVGAHRFVHSLDMFGTTPPLFPVEPASTTVAG
jgi:alkylhydroperoxidase family enzyme